MSENDMKELLPGQSPAEIGAGETPYLGSGSEAGRLALDRLRRVGMVDESNPAERGGGGRGDAIDDWVVQKRGGYENLLQQIQQNKWEDNLVWKLPDGTQVSVAEAKRRAAAAATPPAPEPRPEPQPAPRPADWISKLSADRQNWVSNFLRQLRGNGQTVLRGLQLLIGQIDSGGAVPTEISSWPGNKTELRKVVTQIGGDIRHRLALEKAAGDSEMRQDNEGTTVALRFVGDFKRELQRQYPNDLEKQRKAILNLRSRLRKLDALGFSPDDDLIPPGIDIGVLLQYLRPTEDTEGVNGGI